MRKPPTWLRPRNPGARSRRSGSNSGMRPGEIVRIRAEDLDWSTLQIHIRTGKSKAARRPLPMVGRV